MTTRIALYGGTNLTSKEIRFVRCLTRHLLAIQGVTLISGGFECYREHPAWISVDRAVLFEARQLLPEPETFIGRFETWLPLERLDRPDDGVERFAEGAVHRIPGTDQARRFNLVRAADGIVTIKGEGNTRTVLELALALDKPALPIPFTGGDSRTLWENNREAFLHSLNLRPELISRLEGDPPPLPELDGIARDVAQAMYDAAKKRCLVLMPFGAGHDDFYREVLRRAIEAANYIPHRIDIDDYAGNIPSLFLSALERVRAVVVDVTGLNPNVMYELGQVHARGINPFLIYRRKESTMDVDALPFYLRHEKMANEQNDEAGRRRIADALTRYLSDVVLHTDEQRRHA
uniref:Nucleoside 2-deoxyribosyltransferase n=1 Tax=Geobacter metallireducens TaxID=28232 RepID=A0A831XD40_GEOME